MECRRRFLGGYRSFGVGLVLVLVSVSSVQAAATPADPPAMRAELGGRAISLGDVSRFHCHDLASPLIRCFETPAERDADEAAMAVAMLADRPGALGTTGSTYPYVRWYLDANYGGPSFDASVAYADLGTIGWNDKISSFLTYSGGTYSGGHPRWWRDVGFAGVSWDWGVGVSVSYVGDAANDQFSSVERL